MARTRGRGRPGGAREIRPETVRTETGIAVNIQNETTPMTTTLLVAYYIIRIRDVPLGRDSGSQPRFVEKNTLGSST